MDKLNDAVYKQFSLANIEIPYAKQDLYIRGLPEALSAVCQKVPQTSANTREQ